MPKNGNITGQVFDEDVIKQIEARQNFLGARYRTDANLIYGNNNNAFLRLASSINIGTSSSPIEVQISGSTVNNTAAQEKATSDLLSQGKNQLKERGINENLTGTELAKACVLFGGTVGVDNLLNPKFKYGIVDNGGSGAYDYVSTIAAYGWGGISSKGFVPMPSIESADVSFFNRGALQKASVKIKVYSLEQLQIFDVLYFRIGYTMLLEWGHNIWLDNNLENNPNPINERREFVTDPFKLFFTEGSSQQDIIKSIHSQRQKENYNYDAMLGKVTNFTWKFNDDGSYDIDLNLVGLGDIIESLKINKANIVTNKNELTPSQVADKKQANLDSAYKAADAADTKADEEKAAKEKALQEKVDRINKELTVLVKQYRQAAKNIPIYTWVDSAAASAIKNFKQFASNFNVTVAADDSSNRQAHDTVNSEFTNTYNAGSEIISDEGQTDYGQYYKPRFDNLRATLTSIRGKISQITKSDTKSIKDAEAEAERIKKENEARRRGLDAATQKLKKEEEIRQLSPITSVETKNKTALNLRLYNWRLDAQNGTDPKNLYKLLLTANSANPTSTGASTLSLNFYYVRLGYLLDWVEDNLLLYDSTKLSQPKNTTTPQTTPPKPNPIFTIDTDEEKNYCLRFPAQFSADPKVCVIPSKYDDGTTKWDVLPDLKGYIVDNNQYIGRLMNIFVNIDYIAGCVDKNTDVNGKTNLLKFLTSMFEGINDALGNVNKMEPIFDSEENQLKIIEGSSLEKVDELIADREKKDNNMAVFQVYGIGTENTPYGSFITNVDFQVQLPPNMAAMATISAQSRGNIVGENATGLSKLNLGFTDRLITLKLDKDSIEGVETGKADPKEIFKTNIQAVSKFVSSLYNDKLYSKDTVDSTRSSNRDVALYLTGNDALDDKMPSPFFIPFNLSLNMKGLSGMRNYERFSITEQILPYSYRSGDQKGVIDFLIKGISHKIDNNQWETKIESLTVSSNRKWKIKGLQ